MSTRRKRPVRKLARSRPSVDGVVLTSTEYELAMAMAAALPDERRSKTLDWNRFGMRFMDEIRGAFVILPEYYKLDAYPKALPRALSRSFQRACPDRSIITKHPKWKGWVDFAERVFSYLEGSSVVLTQQTHNQWSLDERRRVGNVP